MIDLQRHRREALKALVSPFLRWPPAAARRDGFTIVIATPWELRHLLDVNLRFLAGVDRSGLDRVLIVFDRPAPTRTAEEFMAERRRRFPALPLAWVELPRVAGRLVARIDQSKFYASLAWVTGLAAARTRWVVLHDFDLFPLDPAYFQRLVGAAARHGWRFAGGERTRFDGLSDEHDLLGTWSLVIDAAWLTTATRPIDCFHAVRHVHGRRHDLDAFGALQVDTPARGLVEGAGPQAFCHVRNLVSTWLRTTKGERPDPVWRLHFLWYLEELAGEPARFAAAVDATASATSPRLAVGGLEVDFSRTHPTCANVLASEVDRMEAALHGSTRPSVTRYLDAFGRFLERFGARDAPPAASAPPRPTPSVGRRARDTVDGLARATGVLEALERQARDAVTILTYHRVLPDALCADYPLPALVIPRSHVERHLRWVSERYRLCTVGEALRAPGAGDRPTVCLTFDDGYADNATVLGPLLAAQGVRATFFVTAAFVEDRELLWFDRAALAWRRDPDACQQACGLAGLEPARTLDDWLGVLRAAPPDARDLALARLPLPTPEARERFAPMTWEHVLRLVDDGHEVGSHGLTHAPLTTLDDDLLAREVRAARELLQQRIGAPVDGFCYPGGWQSERVTRAVIAAGHRWACTTRPGRNLRPVEPFALRRVTVHPARVSDAAGGASQVALRAETFGLHQALRTVASLRGPRASRIPAG